ncbi:hypothetical protein PBI_SCTP2_126 [Salicola phage SCTP-2]|nr:hypothetical protein PBI_SCTP2_126 [Salicola phage SCTP-2]
MNKVILCDIDDVIFNYSYGFLQYHNFAFPNSLTQYPCLYDYVNTLDIEPLSLNVFNKMIEEFNNSEYFSQLNPIHHSVYYINRLLKENYEFVLISKCGNSQTIANNRMRNLNDYFPPESFNDVIMIDYFDSKYRYLKQYEHSDYIWIEDNIENYYIGEHLGLKSILLKTQFNKHEDDYISQVSSWEEIYYHIKNWYE